MKSVPNREEAISWLCQQLASWPITDAYLFGSFLDLRNDAPSDVDLYVCYSSENMSEVVDNRCILNESFFRTFGIKLHLLLLTKEESVESEELLQAMLVNSRHIVSN